MKVLIGYSCCDVTRNAFRSLGHDAWTCDLLPSRGSQENHIEADVWEVAGDSGWDMGIFHPMCTYLTVSAAWAFSDGPYHQKVQEGTLVGAARRAARDAALENFRRLLSLPYPLAIENPAPSFVSKAIRPPDQTIQPYDFGDDASKRTGLWLSGLPKLTPTQRVPGRMVDGKERWSNQTDSGQNKLPPRKERWLERSKTYPGIAMAMADQWGREMLCEQQ